MAKSEAVVHWDYPWTPTDDDLKLQKKLRLKYFLDRVFACLILLLIWPVFLIVALMIKIDGWLHPESSGSVLYKEPRITEGKVFHLYKFRTIPEDRIDWIREKPESRSMTGCQPKTKAGQFILDHYCDEIPQLINIAKGEMSFVGLRPHILEHTREELDSGFYYRLIMRAGLFGIPQACKRDPKYQKLLERMASRQKVDNTVLYKLDGLYVKKCKEKNVLAILFFDAYLVFRCFVVIFRGGGGAV